MTSEIWTLKEILSHTVGVMVVVPKNPDGITGIAFNSSDVKKGDMFLAMPGDRSDGHQYVLDALERGAKYALVSDLKAFDGKGYEAQLIVVRNVPEALTALARAARSRMDGPVIGVTGSAGKTSTKHALAKALGRAGFVHASEKSFNNHVGVPLSLARMPRGVEYAVFELGMSAAGEIDALAELVKPDVAIITSIGLAHRAAFDGIEGIAKAKAEIFRHVQKDGTVILSKESQQFELLYDLAKKAGVKKIIITSIEDKKAHVAVERMVLHGHCSCLTANIFDQRFTFKVGLPGRHWVSNALNVLAAVALVGGDLPLAGISLAEFSGFSGRGKQYQVRSDQGIFTVLDESYNANPISMAASLEVLGSLPLKDRLGSRIAVLGDMEDLGDEAKAQHIAVAEELKKAHVSKVFAYGPMMQHLVNHIHPKIPAHGFSTKSELLHALIHQLRSGDAVLVKGSNAGQLSDIVKGLTQLHQPDEDDAFDATLAAE